MSDAADAAPADVSDAGPALGALRFNEAVSDDEGFVIDEDGQTSDWIELVNAGSAPLSLARFAVETAGGKKHPLPAQTLAAGATVLLFASGEPTRGPRHLDFKLAASKGERLTLRDADGTFSDELALPALGTNEAYARFPDAIGAFARCPLATPGKTNGVSCLPPPPPELPATVTFAPYPWPKAWGAPQGPLALTEVGAGSDTAAGFVEVQNISSAPVDLKTAVVRIGAQPPGAPVPTSEATALALPAQTLAVGARATAPIPVAARGPLSAESVVTLSANGAVVDSVALSALPSGVALSRKDNNSGLPTRQWRLCSEATPGAATATCTTPARTVGDRLRGLWAPGDFAALAAGGTSLDGDSVKFIVDMAAGDSVLFLSSDRWALHYTFIREVIDKLPPLDRCDPVQADAFYQGWVAFSEHEYFVTEGRRYLLGTLVRHGGSGLSTVEFAQGDAISGGQMRRAFFAVMQALPDPEAWAVRPQDTGQVTAARAAEGAMPLVDPNAPFRGVTYQPLTPAVGFGVLRFVPSAQLAEAPLGPDVIVVTDQVPNDLPLVGGLITEAFQTPLSHVNVLSKNRGTPNMALAGARMHPRVKPLLEKLVRLEVLPGDHSLREATAEEAQAFYDSRKPKGGPVAPRLDTSVRGLVDLGARSLDDLPVVGAKAAQLAELGALSRMPSLCARGVPTPDKPFAMPVVHSLEHFAQSGALARLRALRATPEFRADPRVRAQGLAELRTLIAARPVDPGLLAEVTAAVKARFGTAPVRFRSSSNTEDLVGFTGAGLYESYSAALDDPERPIAAAILNVWASLWRPRAYDEREQANIDHEKTAMAILVHPAFPNERANGVAISRDVTDPVDGSAFYFNAQAGEASVTNPAPGVASDEGVYASWRPEKVRYLQHSSLAPSPVLKPDEIDDLMCALGEIHSHFRSRIDPKKTNRWFAVDIEFKFLGPERTMVIKQARPYSFGFTARPSDCREY